MKVSIIIPVYNTERFVEQAILSALEQEETAEVIVVDDGSTDNSLSICKQLSKQYAKIKVFQHPKQANLGPGASRNLGLKNSNYEYIAFLDADDFYLPNRFKKASEIFYQNKNVYGVYEALGAEDHTKGKKKLSVEIELTTMTNRVPPSRLFEIFLSGHEGYFSIIALVFKKELIKKVGFFDEILRQGEDTDFILRMCLTKSLEAGNLEKPVAIRRIHAKNTSKEKKQVLFFRNQLYKKWFLIMLEKDWSKTINRIIFRRRLNYIPVIQVVNKKIILRIFIKIFFSIILIMKHPKCLMKII